MAEEKYQLKMGSHSRRFLLSRHVRLAILIYNNATCQEMSYTVAYKKWMDQFAGEQLNVFAVTLMV